MLQSRQMVFCTVIRLFYLWFQNKPYMHARNSGIASALSYNLASPDRSLGLQNGDLV